MNSILNRRFHLVKVHQKFEIKIVKRLNKKYLMITGSVSAQTFDVSHVQEILAIDRNIAEFGNVERHMRALFREDRKSSLSGDPVRKVLSVVDLHSCYRVVS